MTVRVEVLGLIVLCALVTFIPRIVPFLAARRMRVTPWAVAWFRFLPPSILSALLFPSLLFPDGEWVGLFSPSILSAVVSATIAVTTRSIIAAIVAGMGIYAALLFFLAEKL